MSETHGLRVADDPSQEASLDQLEERICELAAHLAAGTCRFLQLVAEFDARRGWASWDLPSCAAWLAWKCQVAPGTAREQVRVARALTDLPLITQEFAAGRMSYAKVRALTRIVTPATEAELAQVTGPMTAAQCERFAAAYRKASDDDELANRAVRRVSIHVAEDGSVSISARLPATEGAVVLQALRAAAGDCEHPHRPHPDHAEDTGSADGVPAETTPASARPDDDTGQSQATCAASLADAPVQVAGTYLSGKIATASNPDLYHVIIHAGPEALLPATPQPAHISAETPADESRPCQQPGCTQTHTRHPAGTAATSARPAGHPAHPRPLPPRRRASAQPRRRPGHRLPRHHLLDAARPRRQRPRRRLPPPPRHPRPAPRRPRTRQRALPIPRLQLPPHRHPPHHPLGQRRQDPPA
jgi:uncharacterized protein DUF222